MRPAQKAPENFGAQAAVVGLAPRFNEAGAKSAGKPARRARGAYLVLRFNEAGAKSAGKPSGRRARRGDEDRLQ